MSPDGPYPQQQTKAHRAAATFIERLTGKYDVVQALIFGSRARGDDRQDSDLDLAIILRGPRQDFIATKQDMAGLAFDVLMETSMLVQPFPLWEGDLAHPEGFTNPGLIHNIVQDGISV
jgi:antitoxin ChpS